LVVAFVLVAWSSPLALVLDVALVKMTGMRSPGCVARAWRSCGSGRIHRLGLRQFLAKADGLRLVPHAPATSPGVGCSSDPIQAVRGANRNDQSCNYSQQPFTLVR